MNGFEIAGKIIFGIFLKIVFGWAFYCLSKYGFDVSHDLSVVIGIIAFLECSVDLRGKHR